MIKTKNIKKEITESVIDEVVCSKCGIKIPEIKFVPGDPRTASFSGRPVIEDFAYFEKKWGGGFSNKSGLAHHIVLCESCYDVVLNVIQGGPGPGIVMELLRSQRASIGPKGSIAYNRFFAKDINHIDRFMLYRKKMGLPLRVEDI